MHGIQKQAISIHNKPPLRTSHPTTRIKNLPNKTCPIQKTLQRKNQPLENNPIQIHPQNPTRKNNNQTHKTKNKQNRTHTRKNKPQQTTRRNLPHRKKHNTKNNKQHQQKSNLQNIQKSFSSPPPSRRGSETLSVSKLVRKNPTNRKKHKPPTNRNNLPQNKAKMGSSY